MQCRYCTEWNEADERRCIRCGRRLHLFDGQADSNTQPISTSTAPALEALPGRSPMSPGASGQTDSKTPTDPAPPKVIYQPPLFRDASGTPKVIPIPTLTPMRP